MIAIIETPSGTGVLGEGRRSRLVVGILAIVNVEKIAEFVVGGRFLLLFILLDTSIAVGLLQERPAARRVALIRASLSLPFWVLLTWAQFGLGAALAVGVTEGLISAAIITPLAGQPSRARSVVGALLALTYVVILGLMFLLTREPAK